MTKVFFFFFLSKFDTNIILKEIGIYDIKEERKNFKPFNGLCKHRETCRENTVLKMAHK
jgi:hypothetical protein